MTTYQDYKYVMQDTSNLYVGAKYTYDELLKNEDAPFKLKTVIEKYIKDEVKEDTTLESHFYYLDDSKFIFQVFKQLKVKVKISQLVEKKSLFGKKRKVYQTQTIKLDKLVEISPKQKEEMGILIQEIGISKLALMSF